MSPRTVAALVAALLLPVAPLHAQDTTGVTDTTIKIGIPGPLTGSMASSGAAAYGDAAIYRYYNEQGGINGRKFDIVLGDDGCNEAKSVALAKKLIFEDKVFLINGNICSGPALAAKPVIEEAGVPWVISTAVNQGLSTPTVATTFQASQTSLDIGNAMGKFVLSKPGVKKIAIIEHTNEWSKGYRDPAVAYLKAHGVTDITDYTLERGQTDATSQVLRIRSEQPDFIMVILYEPEQVVFLRDAHKYGLATPMIGSLGGDFRDTELRLGSPEPMRHFFMALQYAGLPDGPEMKTWHDKIAQNLPAGQKLSDYTFYGAGSAVAVVSVLQSLGRDVTRERFVAAMDKLHDFNTGIMAGTLSFSPQNHAGAHDLTAVGYDEAGTLSVYKAWGQKAD
jgi:branched-chain amino acid transport system substrate-binding protein